MAFKFTDEQWKEITEAALEAAVPNWEKVGTVNRINWNLPNAGHDCWYRVSDDKKRTVRRVTIKETFETIGITITEVKVGLTVDMERLIVPGPISAYGSSLWNLRREITDIITSACKRFTKEYVSVTFSVEPKT